MDIHCSQTGVYVLAYGSDSGPHFWPKLDQIMGPLSGNTGPRERERQREKERKKAREERQGETKKHIERERKRKKQVNKRREIQEREKTQQIKNKERDQNAIFPAISEGFTNRMQSMDGYITGTKSGSGGVGNYGEI